MDDMHLNLYVVGELTGSVLEFISRISPHMAEFLRGLESAICIERPVNNGG